MKKLIFFLAIISHFFLSADKFLAQNKRPLQNAAIIVTLDTGGSAIAQGKTDSNGKFSFNIPEETKLSNNAKLNLNITFSLDQSIYDQIKNKNDLKMEMQLIGSQSSAAKHLAERVIEKTKNLFSVNTSGNVQNGERRYTVICFDPVAWVWDKFKKGIFKKSHFEGYKSKYFFLLSFGNSSTR